MRWFKTTVLALLAGVSLNAAAQWPARTVRFVVPYAPGAMGDIVMRVVGEELQKTLRQPVLVDNKPGAGGNIGASMVAGAAPDGYTFLVAATNNLVINQFLFINFKYDPLKAFDPVTMLVDVPSVMFMSAAVPAQDFKGFVAWARSRPGAANYGSPGNGTTPHLAMFAITKQLGLTMTHVPYQGAGPAVQALLGDEVQLYLGGAGLGLSYVRAGKLRAIAVSAPTRLEVLPDTPTFDEVGLGAVKASNWWALVAPHGTPSDVIERLTREVQAAMQSPTVKARLSEWGVRAAADGPAALERQLQTEVGPWQKAVAESGAKAD